MIPLKPDFRIKKSVRLIEEQQPTRFYNGNLVDDWRVPTGPVQSPHSFTETVVSLNKIIKLIVSKK
uniref:Uncharacterized protein n=1 Tax=viral metagenome TaxID=1070528 RepID=A0A6C0KX72_9ZZZZ